jgi:hypothetical protein
MGKQYMVEDKDYEELVRVITESQKREHTIVNIGINEFKKVCRSTALPKASQNKLIKGYKRRAWMEWTGVSRLRGSFPTHPDYGKKIKVMRSPKFIDNIEVKKV